MSPSFAASFMRITAIISIITGVIFAFGAVADPTGINDLFFHLVSSGDQGIAGFDTLEAKTGLAIAGGVFAGFSAMLLFLVVPGLAANDRQVIRGAQMALLIWFVVDSGASVASGNAPNALANMVFLALYMTPLLLVREVQTPITE